MINPTIAGFLTSFSIFLIFLHFYSTKENKNRFYSFKIFRDQETIKKSYNFFGLIFYFNKSKLNEIQESMKILNRSQLLEEFLIKSMISSIALGFIYFFVVVQFGTMILAILVGIIGLVMGFKLPEILLKSEVKRQRKIRSLGISSFVEMLQIATEAGITLSLALDRVYQYYPSEFSREFKVANDKFLTGVKGRREAFHEIEKHLSGHYIKPLIDELIQSFETGSPISKSLEELGKEIRREKRKDIKIAAQSIKWKNFMISVFFQLPPFLFILIGPAFYELIRSL